MSWVAIPFTFTQGFKMSADEVFRWATDFDPADIELMGKRGKRKIERVCDDTLVLTDTFVGPDGKGKEKKKLVRVFPQRLAWTNTHISGPNRHSQFIYELIANGDGACHLVFTGSQVVEMEQPTKQKIKALAKEIRTDDAAIWKNLAKELKRSRKS